MDAARGPRSLAPPALIWQGFTAYRAQFGLCLAATALAQLPAWLFAVLVGYGASASLDTILVGTVGEVRDVSQAMEALLRIGGSQALVFGALLVASGLTNVIGTVLSSGALAYLLAAGVGAPGILRRDQLGAATADASESIAVPPHGREALADAYRAVFARLGPLFGALVLAGFIICALLGLVLVLYVFLLAMQYMLVPAGEAPPAWVQAALWLLLGALVVGALGYAMYAFVRWALFVQAVVLEDRGPADALRRSASLLRRRWWQTAALLTLLAVGQGLVAGLASTALAGPLGERTSATLAGLVSGLLMTVANVLYFPIAANALTLFYLGLRARESQAAPDGGAQSVGERTVAEGAAG